MSDILSIRIVMRFATALLLPFFCCLVSLSSAAPLLFEANSGQVDPEARFLTRVAAGGGQTVFFTDRETVFARSAGEVVRLGFPGSNRAAVWEPSGSTSSTISYFVGQDSSRWVRNAPQYEKLIRRQMYPGVDIVYYYGHERQLEYDLVLSPGADVSAIRLRFDTAGRPPRINAKGEIEAGTLRQHPPQIYQQQNGRRRAIRGRFVQTAGDPREFRLTLGAYDRSRPLTIDPVLEFATYFGSDGDEQVTSVGLTWVAGTTSSVAFPHGLSAGRGNRDVFLRWTPIVYGSPNVGLTYIFGGSGDEDLAGIADVYFGAGALSSLILAGTTNSTDFPLALFGSDGVAYHGGASDVFLVQFDLDSVEFRNNNFYSRLFGGSGADRASGIVSAGTRFYVVGTTDSPDLPLVNPIQANLAGATDAFLVSGSRFLQFYNFATYLGGSGDDAGLAVVVGGGGQVSIGGETRSADFPLAGASQGTRQGASDGFLTTIAPDPSAAGRYQIIDSRLIGGSGEDRIQALAVPSFFNAVVANPPIYAAGVTDSPDFPLVAPLQDHLAGETDAFLSRIATSTGPLDFSTYLGGSAADEARALAVNLTYDIFLAGTTQSNDLPVVSPLQGNSGGGSDGFLAVIDHNLQPQQITYLGGTGDDSLLTVAVNSSGSVRVGGSTNSVDLPTTAGAWQPTKNGGADGLVADVGTPFLTGPSHVSLGKDLAITVAFAAGQSAQGALTLTSSDPDKVRFFANGVSSGQAVLEPTSWSVSVEAFADAGDVTITATSPGYPAYVLTVSLYPSAITIAPSGTLSTTAGAQPKYVNSYVVPYDPATNLPTGSSVYVYTLRSGLDTSGLQVTWSSSDPTVADVHTAPELPGFFAVTPYSAGTARISISANGWLPVLPSSYLDVVVQSR